MILASQSPYRRLQLQNFGFRFTPARPLVDEEKLKSEGPTDLTELTRFLSERKARSLANEYPHDLILGSDQLAEIDGQRLDKPGTHQKAFEQLKTMSGREHRLITSLAMVLTGQIRLYTDVTAIRLKKLDDDLIEAYLKQDQPYDCAGSYKIERAGLMLIESVNSADHSAIQGLPLISLLRGFDEYKLKPTDFLEQK